MEGAVQHRHVDAQRVSPFTMAYYCIPTITLISDNREWSRRLMVWTEDTLFVAREKTLVESIPLHEILSVEEMNEDPEPARHSESTRRLSFTPLPSAKPEMTRSSSREDRVEWHGHVLQLKTSLDGIYEVYNRSKAAINLFRLQDSTLAGYSISRSGSNPLGATSSRGSRTRSALPRCESSASPDSKRARRPSDGSKSRTPSRSPWPASSSW